MHCPLLIPPTPPSTESLRRSKTQVGMSFEKSEPAAQEWAPSARLVSPTVQGVPVFAPFPRGGGTIGRGSGGRKEGLWGVAPHLPADGF